MREMRRWRFRTGPAYRPFMALTDAQRDRIVSLRLDGRTVREVVADTGHGSATVSRVWHAYLAETAQDRRPELGLRREELLQRFERNAADARAGLEAALDSEDHSAAARFLAAELAALRRVVELEGLLDSKLYGLARSATVEDPLPYSTPEEALAYRVAVIGARSAMFAAEESLYSFSTLPKATTPTAAELLPVALEAVTESLDGDAA